MKATGNLQTIVPLDAGDHGAVVTAKARYYAPGAIVDFRQCGEGTKIDYQAIKRELREIAANPRGINIIQLSWGLPGWISETIPPWASDPDKGMEAELEAVTKRGIVVVAAAGDDSQGGKLGANYPACSPFCIPAMGSAAFCNRTKRGLVCSESSASRAASELAGAIAMVQSVGGNSRTIDITATGDDFMSLQIVDALKSLGAEPDYNPPIEKYSIVTPRAGKYQISVTPATKIIRYKTDEKGIHWERFGSGSMEVKAFARATVGIVGREDYEVRFRRAA